MKVKMTCISIQKWQIWRLDRSIKWEMYLKRKGGAYFKIIRLQIEILIWAESTAKVKPSFKVCLQ